MSFIRKSFSNKRGIRRYIGPKRATLLLVLTAFISWVWNFYRSGAFDPRIIDQYRADHPLASIALFILIYAVSVIASLPSLPLNLAAGFFWGGGLGGIYATVGVTIGGAVSFSVARWLIGQPLAGRFDNKLVNRLQQEFDHGGWKVLAFMRINPVIPTGPLNYLLGITSVSAFNFLWVTFVFLLPPSITVAYIGDKLQTFTAQGSGANEMIKAILAISAAITLLALIKFVSRLLKK
jgi:uncharacterized membrane protein YdjX (TVP38/TMEM64 family)